MVEQRSKRSRLWRVVLVVSLALNMGVAGLVAGFWVKGQNGGGPQRFDLSLGPIVSALPREDRRAIAESLRANPDFRRTRGGATRPAITAIVTLLRSDTLNEEELRAATTQAGARIVALQAAAADAFVDRIMLMNTDQRKALADRLENIGSHRQKPDR